MDVVVDAHSDILLDIQAKRLMGKDRVLETHWTPKMKQGGIKIRVMAIYVDTHNVPERALRAALDMIDSFHQEIESSDSCSFCTSYADLLQALQSDKIALLLGLEGGEPLGDDIQLLHIFHRLGLRVFGLAHARRSSLADGARYFSEKSGTPGGLSDSGVKFIERAEELHMVIDLVHLNDICFADAMHFITKPAIISHSNSREIFDHPRNITDQQIRQIADHGGVVGINACSGLVGDGGFERLMKHLDHMINIGGKEHVGLGPDFADYAIDLLSPIDRVRASVDGMRAVEGLEGDEKIPRIAEALHHQGHLHETIDKIMGNNFMRVFQEVLN